MTAVLTQFTKLLTTCRPGDEIILNFQDARKLKTALGSHLKAPRARAAGPAPLKKKDRSIKNDKDIDDPFKDIQVNDDPDLDKKLYDTLYGPRKKYRKAPVKQAGKKDKMVTIISDMIDHIYQMIKRGDITINEYLADPDVYLDRRIMGNYIKAPIMKKAIEKHFKRMAGI